ncbi:MAG: hypothetical protein K6C68_10235 [Ruminococcus sp.]|nr:hypothetical protein [Ruminococcus sp.]
MISQGKVMLTDRKPLQKARAAEDAGKQDNKHRSTAAVFAGQFTDSATIFLLAAAAVSAIAGAFSDALPIMLLALMNTAVGFAGEYRSEKIFRRISELTERSMGLTDDTVLVGTTEYLSRVMTAVSFGGSAVCFLLSLIRGLGAADSFYFSAALLIAAVPMGMRSVCLFACSAAMQRSLRAGAAISSCGAIEKLAAAGALCIGKSGILTSGYVSAAAIAVMSGEGVQEYEYSEAEGRLTRGSCEDGFRAWEDSALSRLLICAAVCSNARAVRCEGSAVSRDRGRRSRYEGDPCEAALLRLCSACGIERGLLLCERLSEKPFSEQQGYMQVTVREADGSVISYIKGYPEAVAYLCALSAGTAESADGFCDRYGAAARLIAFAMNDGSGWKYLGLAAMRESLRPRSAEQVRRLRRSGVRTVMLSADHHKTAASAAARAAVLTPDSLSIDSSELARMSDEELYDNVRGISLVSRVTDEQRVRVMSALQSRGVRCAFACDSPPQTADVRISASDKSADILLTGGGISAIAEAVNECRAVSGNVRRSVCCMLSSEVGILLTVTGAAAMGMPILFKSCHLLAAALLCGSFPALLLSSAPAPRGRAPAEHDDPEKPFGGGRIAEAVGRGVLTALCTLGCSSILLGAGCTLDAVRGSALLTLVFSDSLTFAGHSQRLPKSARASGIITPAAVMLTLMCTDPLSRFFSLYFPGARYAAAAALMASALPIVEKLRYYAEKRLVKK